MAVAPTLVSMVLQVCVLVLLALCCMAGVLMRGVWTVCHGIERWGFLAVLAIGMVAILWAIVLGIRAW